MKLKMIILAILVCHSVVISKPDGINFTIKPVGDGAHFAKNNSHNSNLISNSLPAIKFSYYSLYKTTNNRSSTHQTYSNANYCSAEVISYKKVFQSYYKQEDNNKVHISKKTNHVIQIDEGYLKHLIEKEIDNDEYKLYKSDDTCSKQEILTENMKFVEVVNNLFEMKAYNYLKDLPGTFHNTLRCFSDKYDKIIEDLKNRFSESNLPEETVKKEVEKNMNTIKNFKCFNTDTSENRKRKLRKRSKGFFIDMVEGLFKAFAIVALSVLLVAFVVLALIFTAWFAIGAGICAIYLYRAIQDFKNN